ncbi:MAG: 1-deoxy-D-xylulose-5-phosphate reductoisomerase [Pelagibacterales bacterium]|jgi:1-deoxy-D-xylulose-5-phosphate reductoisomerase|nr:1-deoxy-D-xylulose-5-phosphate reductoisomerase [Pelagibacterales bacterium]
MPFNSNPKTVSIFGVTGSVGTSAQEVIMLNKDNFVVDTIVSNNNVKALIKAAILLNPKLVIIRNKEKFTELEEALGKYNFILLFGDDNILESSKRNVDIFVAAIIGYAGLITTYSSVGNAKIIALANKESLVCAGPILINKANNHNSNIIPIDSEHNTLFQILSGYKSDNISKMIITASGGPFRGYSIKSLNNVSPAEATAHPVWDMGKKISVDSATLMNKGLELIEAVYLFNISPEKINIIVHPESIVHGIIEFDDGSMSAGLSTPNMRTPISYALNYPNKVNANVNPLNLTLIKSLNFENVNEKIFRSVQVARDALQRGHSSVISLNAANEIAVNAFLNKKINFLNIINIVERSVLKMASLEINNIDDIIMVDQESRKITYDLISRGNYK